VRGIVVEDALDFSERLMGKLAIEAIRPSMLILAKGFRNHGAADVMARAVSVAGASSGCCSARRCSSPIGIAVKLDSRGSDVLRPAARRPQRTAVRPAQIPDDASLDTRRGRSG
jgi:hypothetical protein